MGKRLGGSNISIAQLRDGYSYTEIKLYSEVERSSYPLTLLYNFTTGTLLSGVDGKTLAECLNGWSQEPGTGKYCTIASARTTGEIAEIATSSWCEQFITSEDGETVTTVTLYTRASSSPSLPTGTLEYDFSTGTITGTGKGEWVSSMEDFTGGTAYALWSTSAIAVMGANGKASIESSKWSTPKKIAENGVSPVEMYLGRYSYIFPATEDGIIVESDYLAFSSDVLLVQGGKSIDFSLSVISSGITYAITEGKTVKLTEDSVMLGDTASIKVIATYDGGSISKSISLAKAKAGKDVILYFAWSKSEDEFIPKNSEFFMWGNVFNFFNGGMTGSFPLARWTSNREKLEKLKDDVYCYLWAKLTEDGTPFLFTGKRGLDGLTGACTLYQYYASTSSTEQTGGEWLDEMPSIAGGKFLWMRTKFVPAGGNADDYEWGTPVIAGSDISLLMASLEEIGGKVEQNTTAITANSEAIATKVSQDTFNELGERVSTAETRIEQNAEAIELRATTEEVESKIAVTEGKIALYVDGTDVKTPAGIVVGVVDGEGYVKINAPNIIAEGTITAEQLRADCISGKTFIVKNGGVIRSETLDDTTGFSLAADGKFSAFNAYLNGILDTPVLQTQNENAEGVQIDVGAMDEQNYYLGSQMKEKVKEMLTPNTLYNVSADGFDFNKIVVKTESMGDRYDLVMSNTVIASGTYAGIYVSVIGPEHRVALIQSIISWQAYTDSSYSGDTIVGKTFGKKYLEGEVYYAVGYYWILLPNNSYSFTYSTDGANWSSAKGFPSSFAERWMFYASGILCMAYNTKEGNPQTIIYWKSPTSYVQKTLSTYVELNSKLNQVFEYNEHYYILSKTKLIDIDQASITELTLPDNSLCPNDFGSIHYCNGYYYCPCYENSELVIYRTPVGSYSWSKCSNGFPLAGFNDTMLVNYCFLHDDLFAYGICNSDGSLYALPKFYIRDGFCFSVNYYCGTVSGSPDSDTGLYKNNFGIWRAFKKDENNYYFSVQVVSDSILTKDYINVRIYRFSISERENGFYWFYEATDDPYDTVDMTLFESSYEDYLTDKAITVENVLSLPSSIPSGMDFYRRIPELSTEEKDYISINKANVPALTYWDTNLNADVALDAVTTAKIVQTSKTQWLFDNIVVLSSSWYFKNLTSLDAYFTPNSKSIGTYTKDINPIDEDPECSIGNITPYKFIIGNKVEASTVEAEEKISAPTIEATTEVMAPSLKVGANSKVIIGQDEESGYIDIYNVDQGENAVHWHIDVAGNVLRFVLNNATEVCKMDENGVYGAVFN